MERVLTEDNIKLDQDGKKEVAYFLTAALPNCTFEPFGERAQRNLRLSLKIYQSLLKNNVFDPHKDAGIIEDSLNDLANYGKIYATNGNMGIALDIYLALIKAETYSAFSPRQQKNKVLLREKRQDLAKTITDPATIDAFLKKHENTGALATAFNRVREEIPQKAPQDVKDLLRLLTAAQTGATLGTAWAQESGYKESWESVFPAPKPRP